MINMGCILPPTWPFNDEANVISNAQAVARDNYTSNPNNKSDIFPGSFTSSGSTSQRNVWTRANLSPMARKSKSWAHSRYPTRKSSPTVLRTRDYRGRVI
jgi:hypothetical protein